MLGFCEKWVYTCIQSLYLEIYSLEQGKKVSEKEKLRESSGQKLFVADCFVPREMSGMMFLW